VNEEALAHWGADASKEKKIFTNSLEIREALRA
jgi:hypothetical protein